MNSMLRLGFAVVLGLTVTAAAKADDRIAGAIPSERKAAVAVVAPAPGYDTIKMEAVQSYGSTLDAEPRGNVDGYDPTIKMDATSPGGGFTPSSYDDAFLQRVWMGP